MLNELEPPSLLFVAAMRKQSNYARKINEVNMSRVLKLRLKFSFSEVSARENKLINEEI